jgi:hypothetical protein
MPLFTFATQNMRASILVSLLLTSLSACRNLNYLGLAGDDDRRDEGEAEDARRSMPHHVLPELDETTGHPSTSIKVTSTKVTRTRHYCSSSGNKSCK